MIDFWDFNQSNYLASLAEEYRRSGRQVTFLPFVYGLDFLGLAQNVVTTLKLTINNDADFLLCQRSSVCNDAAGNLILRPTVTVLMVVDSSQRACNNVPTLLPLMFGSGPRPYLLPKPLLLPARSTCSLTLNNFSATVLSVRLAFVGVKVFQGGAA
jgi:hypothetical protein